MQFVKLGHLFKFGLLGIGAVVSLGAMVSLTAGSSQDPTVGVGGNGPAPYFEKAVDRIADALKADGVKVKVLSGDARTRTALVDETKNQGFNNLLYLTLESPRDNPKNESRGDLIAACFVDGKQAWEEKTKGPLVLPLGKEHEVDDMVNGMVKKINKRAGGVCLPK